MLGTQVVSDLKLATLSDHVPLKTTWGHSEFQTGILNLSADALTLKRRQLPLLALKANPAVCLSIAETLASVAPNTATIDDAVGQKDDKKPTLPVSGDHPPQTEGPLRDDRISESVLQVLWKSSHIGAVLNTSPLAMNLLIGWRTLIIPFFAVIAPLIAVVVPFFLLPYMNPGLILTTDDYLAHVRNVLRQQITIPSFLRSKRPDDIVGFLLESAFIALTIGMFMSGIWSQIANALHLRTIWFDLEVRGDAIQHLYRSTDSILKALESLPDKAAKGCSELIQKGRAAHLACSELESLSGVATFGSVWNNPVPLQGLKTWIAELDCLTAIAQLEGICFPVILRDSPVHLRLIGVHHPAVPGCIPNNLQTLASTHTLLTGPNRGGKSTYCQSVGLAVVCAQSWGFAWAESMSWTPFDSVLTALESSGTLGSLSTFESEIEFAKSVLAFSGVEREKGCRTKSFVMMDEIFHSTNAADGFAASQVFLSQLYAKSGIVSIVSTHYKDLADTYKNQAMPLCMEATEQSDKTLSYSYKVIPGISDKSSVMEILKERGLYKPGAVN